MRSLSDERLAGFAALVARAEPAPGGGAGAAAACAIAAALVEKAAALSPGAEAAGIRASAIREQALALADDDAETYGAVIAAQRTAAGEERTRRVQAALSRAADVPLQIAEFGAEVAELAQELERDGNPNLAGDAAVAALLAAAASAGAARLVTINLAEVPEDPRARRAAELSG
jgi:methenyltetrahydrofolate cyclohydrolase